MDLCLSLYSSFKQFPGKIRRNFISGLSTEWIIARSMDISIFMQLKTLGTIPKLLLSTVIIFLRNQTVKRTGLELHTWREFLILKHNFSKQT